MNQTTVRQTGYPSVDRPWLKYYSQEAIDSTLSSKCMYQYLFDTNANNLGNTALSYFGRNISYGKLLGNIKKAAAIFADIGIKKGDVVSFCTVTVPEVIYAFYALNMIGAVANMIDPRTSIEGIESYIEESNSNYLIILDILQSKLEKVLQNDLIRRVIIVSPADSMPAVKRAGYKLIKHCGKGGLKCITWKKLFSAETGSTVTPREYEKDLPVLILHTGGTTGNPKGVLFSDDSYNRLNDQFNYYQMLPSSGDVALNIMPPFIAYGMAVGIHRFLCCGCKVVVVPVFDPGKFDRLILKYRPQHFWGVPTHLDGIRFSRKIQKTDLSFLITPGVGGDALKTDSEIVLNKFLREHGCKNGVIKGYGMTEVNSAVCACSTDHNKVGSVGVPLVHSVISAFVPGTQEELPYGEQGEICIQTPSRMLGYLNNEEETSQVMQVHADGSTWIHSGDVGYVTEDGYVYIIDRLKRMIIREDGFKVYPSKIENVICGCKGVLDCAVVGARSEQYSQGEVPIAFITVRNDGHSDEIKENVLNECKRQLADYQIPADIKIINELPLTKVGKIDYRALENSVISQEPC